MNRKLGKMNLPFQPSAWDAWECQEHTGTSDEKRIHCIERALDLGHNFLDTADYYLSGHNEFLIAKAIQGKRETAFLSVKTGMMASPASPEPVNGHPE